MLHDPIPSPHDLIPSPFPGLIVSFPVLIASFLGLVIPAFVTRPPYPAICCLQCGEATGSWEGLVNEAGHPDRNSRLCEMEISGDEYLLWDAAVIDCAHFTTVALTSVG